MKIELQDSELNQLRYIVFVANTPGFIFNSILDEGIAERLAHSYPSKEILRNIKRVASRSGKTVTEDEALTLIALAIALKYNGPDDANRLALLDVPWFNWWRELRQMILNETRSDSFVSLEAKNVIDTGTGFSSRNESAENSMTIDLGGEG